MANDSKNFDGLHWIYKGIAVMFILIGIAVVLSVVLGHAIISIPNFGWFGDLIGIFIIIWICSWFFGWPLHSWRHAHRQGNDGKQILKMRYARGEISQKQYESMMKDLEKH